MKPWRMREPQGFDVGGEGQARSPTRRAGSFPLCDHRPVEQGEKGTVLLDKGISVEQGSNNGLVKAIGRGYDHSRKLLCVSGMCFDIHTLQKSFSEVSSRFFGFFMKKASVDWQITCGRNEARKWRRGSTDELLATDFVETRKQGEVQGPGSFSQ